MTNEALNDLKAIIDLLGPNMWLQLDEVAMGRFFGSGADVLQRAKAFASRTRCVFIPDTKTGAGRFGRAYFKRG